jgi:Tol biopolymer transport system component
MPISMTRQSTLFFACLAGLLGGCGGGDSSPAGPGPTTGTIRVTAITQGVPIDPSGYTASLDNGPAEPLPLNGASSFSAVAPGAHNVAFSGWRFNCQPTNASAAQVSVRAGDVSEAHLDIACSQAPPAGPGRELVFATRRDGVGELYLVNDNGAGLIRLMTDRTDLEPAWSPDGSRIALRSNLPGSTGPGTNGEILLMNPDGSGLTNITNDPEAFDIMPAWAPGGEQLVYARITLATGATELYTINADGTARTRVTDGWHPHWAPDASRIVFVDTVGPNRSDLYLVHPDGSNRVNLLSTPGVTEEEPVWSPDGSKIAFASDASGRFEIYVVETDGTALVQLTSSPAGERRDPAWSPDGARIAYTVVTDAGQDIHVMNADGSEARQLTYGGGQHASWRP